MKLKIENEKKFLVKALPRSYLEYPSKEITQWYISIDPPIRVRVENFDTYYLTIKIKQKPGVNREYEQEIHRTFANTLLRVRKFNKIRKTRHLIGILELDVFLAQLGGLVLLEFEKKSKDDAFEMPTGIMTEEVTGDPRFENHNLAKLDAIPEEWRCKIV